MKSVCIKKSSVQNKAASCGNCWGYEEWNGEIEHCVEVNANNKKNAFILAFVKKIFG